jgi:hypothetical protein
MKKVIRLTESDLARIVRRVLNEQLTKHGDEYWYDIKKDYLFNFVSKIDETNYKWKKTIKLEKGTTLRINYKNQSIVKAWLSASSYVNVLCGIPDVIIYEGLADMNVDDPKKYPSAIYSNPTYVRNVQKLFCDGDKLKKPYEIETFMGGINKPKETPKKDSRCKFTEKEFKNEQVCFISKDNTWMYAKTDDGKWYTSKQTDRNTWCELTTPKFQTAIDKLNVECKGLMPIPKLQLKPI